MLSDWNTRARRRSSIHCDSNCLNLADPPMEKVFVATYTTRHIWAKDQSRTHWIIIILLLLPKIPQGWWCHWSLQNCLLGITWIRTLVCWILILWNQKHADTDLRTLESPWLSHFVSSLPSLQCILEKLLNSKWNSSTLPIRLGSLRSNPDVKDLHGKNFTLRIDEFFTHLVYSFLRLN